MKKWQNIFEVVLLKTLPKHLNKFKSCWYHKWNILNSLICFGDVNFKNRDILRSEYEKSQSKNCGVVGFLIMLNL